MNRSAIAALGGLLLASGSALGQTPLPATTMRYDAPARTDTPTTFIRDAEGNWCDCGPTWCADEGRWWAQADYLLWRIKKGPNPVPLLTTGSDEDFIPGALFQPTTVILYGNENIEFGSFSGLRLSLGGWLDNRWGVEVRTFLLEQKSVINEFRSDSQGNNFLLRPFFNSELREQDVATVSFPSLIAGGISFAPSTRLWGVEGHLLYNFSQGMNARFDGILGLRCIDLEEQIRIDENYVPLPIPDNVVAFNGNAVGFPNTISINENFKTRNQFYGVQFGVQSTFSWGNWWLRTRYEVSLGTTHSRVDIQGFSTQRVGYNGDIVSQVPYGILALPTNSGRRTSDSFAVLPSAELQIGYQVTDACRVHLGYSFMYLSSVMRPGNQIDNVLNPAQVPTFGDFEPGNVTPPPLVRFQKTDFWAAGVDFGIEFRF
ncbi:MAG TPA: BBP7 family outer membrane beta-barrel protein [Gemmatales bacterium]|nr:BBP7 family outer membrane beta-barrel protein [Gemmatales bacterium]HMP60319.1 BBP7 family outer membrane beta-barrel protein [Gemmatales bacterium]